MVSSHTSLQSEWWSQKPLSRISEQRPFSSQHDTLHPHDLTASPEPSAASTCVHQPSNVVPTRGSSASPIKRPSMDGKGLRTFVPAVLPTDILDLPKLAHPRIQFDVCLSAPLFVGGATIEGSVHVRFDPGIADSKRQNLPSLKVHGISATLIGVERHKSRRDIFRALTTKIIHLPDLPLIENAIKPFAIDLPLKMGPPPYKAKKVGIYYLLSTLIEFRVEDQTNWLRQNREVNVLTVHNPEKVLVNLSEPLIVKDSITVAGSCVDCTCGLYRQTWINGYPLFVDIRIDNRSKRPFSKVEVQLERVTMIYLNGETPTNFNEAKNLLLPDEMHKQVLARQSVLRAHEIVSPHSELFRTASLSLPSGLVSIETGRFFGVRYFLNVLLTVSFNKLLKLQLPVTLVHPNSIDIPPNALAQVAASIEQEYHQKRTNTSRARTRYHYEAGQAFAAARRKSFIQLAQDTFGTSDMESLTRAIESSPRRLKPQSAPVLPRRSTDIDPFSTEYATKPQKFDTKMRITRRQSTFALGDGNNNSSRPSPLRPRAFRTSSAESALRYRFPRSSETTGPSGPHQRVSFDNRSMPRSSVDDGTARHWRKGSGSGTVARKGPRLQRSTSGLGFESDESEKENQTPQRLNRFIL